MNDFIEIDLRISGPAELQNRSQKIRVGDTVRVGRAPSNGIEIPWDRRISREQADLYFDGDQLHITCLVGARNPVLCGKRAYREVSLNVGQEFRIGETRFTLRESEASMRDSLNQQFGEEIPADVVENAYSSHELLGVELNTSQRQMEILATLPGLIAAAQDDGELVRCVLPRLLDGIRDADGVVIAQFDDAWLEESAGPDVLTRPKMIEVLTRSGFGGQFRPSRRLILKALREQQSHVHVWSEGEGGRRFTVSDGLEWAFCVPLRNEFSRGWCIFVAGRLTQVVHAEEVIQSDLRFAEVLAKFIVASRQLRSTSAQVARLNTTFSPRVATAVASHEGRQLLKPAERDMTTLVCGVQGISSSNVGAARGLSASLEAIRETLKIVVSGILDRDGAIVEVRSDGATALWGWPLPSPDGPIAACQAALDIARSFMDESLHEGGALDGIDLGIGIAHGTTIAGPIGPPIQANIGTYGPAVSHGTLLAASAKQFGVTICLDEPTAGWVQLRLNKREGRVRRLARVRSGRDGAAMDVFGLLPPLTETPTVTEEMIIRFDAAIDALIDGHWQEARSMLDRMPDSDKPTQFLLDKMAESSNLPPVNWDGVFSLC